MDRRSLTITAVTIGAIAVAALPVVLAVALGWHKTSVLGSILGPDSDIFVIMSLVYMVWLPATVVGLVWVFDHLGYQYQVIEREPRPTRRERRRAEAAREMVGAEQQADLELERRRTQQQQQQKTGHEQNGTGE